MPALSQRFQVIIVDNRDAGQSSRAKKASYSIADMADDTAGLLDALGVGRAHLLGLSMGGMIAQEFALRHAEWLNHFICRAAEQRLLGRLSIRFLRTWSFVKANDKSGEVFACQQFSGHFPQSSCATRPPFSKRVEMLKSNPHSLDPEAYGPPSPSLPAIRPRWTAWPMSRHPRSSSGESKICSPRRMSAVRSQARSRAPASSSSKGPRIVALRTA